MSDQNIFAAVLDKVRAADDALIADGVLPAGTRPVPHRGRAAARARHGDMATNAAMVLAKDAGGKPRELAATDRCKAACRRAGGKGRGRGAGLHQPDPQAGGLDRRLARDACSGRGLRTQRCRAGDAVNVEYVSANPTGPMHVGHGRGAVFGDALANLLAFSGFEVTREYYINDAGAQVDVLARSAFLRYREALGEDIGAIPEGLYPGDYLKPVGAALAAELRREPEGQAGGGMAAAGARPGRST